MLNDTNAKLISREQLKQGSGNYTVEKFTYLCPCGKGTIEYYVEPGYDRYTIIKCHDCDAAYRVVEGCGHLWELKKR